MRSWVDAKWSSTRAHEVLRPLGRGGLSQHSPDSAGVARSGRSDALVVGLSVRRMSDVFLAGRFLPSSSRAAWAKAPGTGLRVTWLGHSTALIEIDGYRVLTDPVWGPRASPSRLIGPKRFQPVPVALRALPPIDLVTVSPRPLRSSRLSDDSRAGEARRAIRHFARCRRASGSMGRTGATHRRARLVGDSQAQGCGLVGYRRAVAAFFRPRPARPQRHALVIDGDSILSPRRIFQRRYRLDDRVRNDPRAGGSVRSHHARSRRLPSGMG